MAKVIQAKKELTKAEQDALRESLRMNNINMWWRKEKAIPKAQLLKLEPLTWLFVKYQDSLPEAVLLLTKPVSGKFLFTFSPDTGLTSNLIGFNQVIDTLGRMDVPDPFDKSR